MNDHLKDKVIILRGKGKTYSEIQNLLGIKIPKSTLSNWCKNIKPGFSYNKKIQKLVKDNLSKARIKSVKIRSEAHNKKLFDYQKQNIELVNFLKSNKKAQKLTLAILYACEGSKWKAHRGLMLGSSDQDLIILYIKLLKKVYNISLGKLKARISYRYDQDIEKLTAYWSKITKINKKNFYKTTPDARTKGKKTKKLGYKGVCVIYCAGTDKQLEMQEINKIISMGL